MASYTSAAAAEDDSQFMTDGGYDASVTSVSEQANNLSNRKRKSNEDSEVVKKHKVQENRAIYVTDLPLDTDEAEIAEVFSRYGMIDLGADGNKRIKMYADDEGAFNGEALIVYFKKESIDIAVRMMDEFFYRAAQPENKIRVKEADFSYKRNKDSEQIVSKLTRQDKKASERSRADLNRKLAEWSDNEEEVKQVFAPKKNKWAKVCIVKYAFTLEELDEDPEAYFDIKDEMAEEAEKHGEFTNITLFDMEADGIVTIRFREFESAEKFRAAAHGRNFAGRTLEVTIPEDRVRFKKSSRAQEPDSSDEETPAQVPQN